MFEIFTNIYLLPLAIATLIQLLFIWILFGKLAFRKKNDVFPENENLTGVSVVIVAKNEAENLYNFLPKVLSQNYPVYEVIVVDDQSADESVDVLKAFKKHYSHLEIVYIGQEVVDRPGKKLAISLGIKKAKYPLILLTDADCSPASDNWIRTMARNFTEGKEIILGYSPYQSTSTLLNLFIQYDTFYTALQYLSFALSGIPYMGVGRNLMYSRELFNRNAFNGQLHIPFGDDDLFVNKNANKINTCVEIHKDSFIVSLSPQNFSKWYRQKRRHLKAGNEYKKSHKIWLFLIWFSFILFASLFGLAISEDFTSYYIWGLFAVRYISIMVVAGFSLKKLRIKYLIWIFPILEALYNIIYIPVMSLVARFSKFRSW